MYLFVKEYISISNHFINLITFRSSKVLTNSWQQSTLSSFIDIFMSAA
jgi:hypothetical protein